MPNRLADILGIDQSSSVNSADPFFSLRTSDLEDDTTGIPGIGSAFSKLQQLVKSETQGLQLQQQTEQRRLRAESDSVVGNILDGIRTGVIRGNPNAVLTSAHRATQMNSSSLAYKHAQELEEQNNKVTSIDRFFALTPGEILAKTEKSGGLRSQIVYDPNTNTYVQQAKPNIDENVTRAQEIAEKFSVPTEAVYAKREQQQVLESKLLRQEITDTSALARLQNEGLRRQDLARVAAKKAAFEQSPLGWTQDVIKQTRNIPSATLEQMMSDETIDAATKVRAKASLGLRSQQLAAQDEKNLDKVYQRQLLSITKKVQTDFANGSSAEIRRYAPSVIGKDGKLDTGKLQQYASTHAKMTVKMLQQEGRQTRLTDFEHEYGPGGVYDNLLNDNKDATDETITDPTGE